MRALLLTSLLGMLTMTIATADEPETLKEGTRVWNEKVTVKVWVEKQRTFLKPVAPVWAERKNTEKGLMFDVRATVSNNTPGKGSVLIDKDGNEFTVIEAESPPSGLFVKLTKAAPKKP